MVFTQPYALLLLLLIPVIWILPRPVRDTRHGLIRSLVILLTVLALARPVSVVEDTAMTQVFILDASDSAAAPDRDGVRAALAGALEGLSGTEHLRLIAIGTVSEEILRDRRWESVVAMGVEPSHSGSPISGALEAAAASIPVGSEGAVTLISDGRATDPRWGGPIAELSSRGIPLHTVALGVPTGDAYPVAIDNAEPLRVGSTARVLVDVVYEGGMTELSIALGDSSGELTRVDGFRCNGRSTATLEFEPKEAGFLPLTATVSIDGAADAVPGNDTLTRTFAVQSPIRVLYMGHRMYGGADRMRDLVGRGFDITDAGDPERRRPDFSDYDLVMVDDRPATELPAETQRDLIEAVKNDGLGVMVTGGGASFGPGGFYQSPLESVLPIEFVQKEEKKDPSTALAIIIDTSGSMAGNRIRLAKEVTRLAIRRLLPHDKVGIVEFYGAKRWAAPIQSAANAIDIQRALNRLDAGGGTVLLPAIEEAYYGLRNVQTRYKHVMVLTDAGVETGPYERIMRRMARDGICVSTVLVGPGRHSEFLVQVADWGNGRYYNASDRFNLPEIMLKQPSTARLPGYRPGTHPLEPRGGRGWWGDVDPQATPALAGYVESRERPGAEVLLRTATESHPVLATWRYGLGRVTTFMTEPTGPGTSPWRDWDGFGPLFARVLSRTASEQRLPYSFELARADHRVKLTAKRTGETTATPTARVATGDDESRELRFREHADGVHTAQWIWDPAVPARVFAGIEGPRGERFRGEWRLVSDPHEDIAPESNVDPATAVDLQRASGATGGESISMGGLASFVPPTGGRGAPLAILEFWPYCLFLALLAYLGDIAYRRSRFSSDVGGVDLPEGGPR